MEASLIAALFALSAALAWGAGDFTNGLVARKNGPARAVFLSYAAGFLALVSAALARGEALPSGSDALWGALAGLMGMLGLGFLMRGFATGLMGVVAPISAVLATAIPVIFSALTQGLPNAVKMAGFGLALGGVWLLSRPEKSGAKPAAVWVALLAGLGFGGFFVAFGQVRGEAVFWPVAVSRLSACLVMGAFFLITRRPIAPLRSPLWMFALAGVLDVCGNLFFLLAVQAGRLDVASVLGSLYPAVTAILAMLITREHLSRMQMVGLAAAVAAIVLITL